MEDNKKYKDRTKSVRIGKEIYRRLKIHVATVGGTMTDYMDKVLGQSLPPLPKNANKNPK